MVPDNECRMPTLMVSAAWIVQVMPIAAMDAERVKALIKLRRFMVRSPSTQVLLLDRYSGDCKGCACLP